MTMKGEQEPFAAVNVDEAIDSFSLCCYVDFLLVHFWSRHVSCSCYPHDESALQFGRVPYFGSKSYTLLFVT
jgi:hypothetical protein